MVFGCTSGEREDTKSSLQIYSMSTGLGAISRENTHQQCLTYTINLTNEKDQEDYIEWIEPILGEGIKDKVINEDLKVNVKQSISAKGSLEVEGEIVFNTQGLTKEEIINLEPFITGIKVGSEKVIVINLQLDDKQKT